MLHSMKKSRKTGKGFYVAAEGLPTTTIKGDIVKLKIDGISYRAHEWATSWARIDGPLFDTGMFWPMDYTPTIGGKKTLEVTKKEDIKFEQTI